MQVIDQKNLVLISGGGNTFGAEGIANATSIGAGWGAARAIGTAGSLGALGAGATVVGGAALAGLLASYHVGDAVGTYLYENSDTVRGTMAEAMDNIFGNFDVVDLSRGVKKEDWFGGMSF